MNTELSNSMSATREALDNVVVISLYENIMGTPWTGKNLLTGEDVIVSRRLSGDFIQAEGGYKMVKTFEPSKH